MGSQVRGKAMSDHQTTVPAWCSYPEPTRPKVGCWSLLGGRITKAADCDKCECKVEPANVG